MGKITIRDVAREAGVSISLVSLVMNAKRDAEGNLDCNVNKVRPPHRGGGQTVGVPP